MANNRIESHRHKTFLEFVEAHPEGCTRQQIHEQTGLSIGALNVLMGHYCPSKIRVIKPSATQPRIIYPKQSVETVA